MPASDITKSFSFFTPGVTQEIDNRLFGCQYWVINFQSTGFTAISLQFEAANVIAGSLGYGDTPGSFSKFPTLHFGSNPSALLFGTISCIGYMPFVRLNFLSATGAGVVSATIQGFQKIPSPVPAGGFAQNSTPGVGVQAIVTIAAVPGVRHVCTGLTFSAAATTAPAISAFGAALLDGVTTKLGWEVGFNAVTGQLISPVVLTGLNIPGTPNTAMIMEFSAAIANVFQSVSITGYDTTE